MSSARNDSSSDDEPNFQSNIQLPDLEQYKKNKKKNSSTNIYKAGKKFVTNKSVRFPESSPRQSYISADSSVQSSDDDDDSSMVVDPSLPRFQFGGQEVNATNDDDNDNDIIDQDDIQGVDSNPSQLEETDSEDELVSPRPITSRDSQDIDKRLSTELKSIKSLKSEASGDSKNSKSSKPRVAFRKPSIFSNSSRGSNSRHEVDITDQHRSDSISSSDTRNSAGGGLFKDILNRITLQDQAYPEGRPSDSDTFIGKVLENGGSIGGLSGGGLTPGAFSRPERIDEEEEVGMEDSNNIELKKLNFAQLNNEAMNLINVHVPSNMQDGSQFPSTIVEESSSDTMVKSGEESPKHVEEEHREGFYAPNPDLFLRGAVNTDHDDGLLLDLDDAEVAPPKQVQAGVLSSLLKLYQNPHESKSTSSLFEGPREGLDDLGEHRTTSSTLDFGRLKHGIKHGGKMVYDKLPGKRHGKSHTNASGLSTTNNSGAEDSDGGEGFAVDPSIPSFQNARPKMHKKAINAADMTDKVAKKLKKTRQARRQEQLRITVHISEVLQRQRFILRMCKALMLFGAPTHRLEEYMVMTSRVLEIDGQFIYFPGCMIIAFGDAATRTSEVHLVKCAQGVNLSKLSETHKLYKGVIHDLIGVEEASIKLDKLLSSRNNYPPWLCVFFYGLGSAMVCPFAFGGGWVDVPVTFGVGLCVGYLQFFVSSISNLYSSVFEVTASIVVSFIARAIGSVRGGNLFCFAAIAQGSLALILPGYIILCGSLELQSRNLVAGSVRMFYAIIYSLFLGFGITLGAALYGWVDKSSTSQTVCSADHQIDPKWRILFVPAYSACLGLINQAFFHQLPVMIIISGIGYVGSYFASLHFVQVSEFTSCIGAFIIGVLGNLYSRIGKGLAVSAMLPAIFVQVPSGIASQSSLLSGIQAADQITRTNQTSTNRGGGALSFGSAMVEVAVGISVGLFAAALIVYPFGKKRTGLFTL